MLDIADLEPVLDRIDPTFGRHIDCGPGWFSIIMDLHKDLVAIDPDYQIYQIKEKFGGLRFYFRASSPDLHASLMRYVNLHEERSRDRCELTGKSGYLMKKQGRFRTLSLEFLNDGWEQVEVN